MNWIKLSDQLPPLGETVILWHKINKDPQFIVFATRFTEKDWDIRAAQIDRKVGDIYAKYIDPLYSHWCRIEDWSMIKEMNWVDLSIKLPPIKVRVLLWSRIQRFDASSGERVLENEWIVYNPIENWITLYNDKRINQRFSHWCLIEGSK